MALISIERPETLVMIGAGIDPEVGHRQLEFFWCFLETETADP
jgi:hypothetical protein